MAASKPPSSPKRALSAARAQPLAAGPRRITGEMMRVGATDTALNAAGVLRDTWDDFKSSDRYFKYKALVIFCWLALSVTSVGIACPSSGFGSTNSVGARLVIAGEANKPIYMVKNDSPEPWQDVEVLVNGKYRATTGQVASNNGVTLSPIMLYDESGTRAPNGLNITEISLKIGAEDPVSLLVNGAAP